MKTLTITRLRELLEYDPKTGIFLWRVKRRGFAVAGGRAGSQEPNGYFKICIDGQRFRVHCIAWLYTYGEWPTAEIDHIDGNPSNNRIGNLRLATRAQNGQNRRIGSDNRSGVTGVSWDRHTQKWVARIKANGKRKHLGLFQNFSDAVAARRAAEVVLHSEFRRGGGG